MSILGRTCGMVFGSVFGRLSSGADFSRSMWASRGGGLITTGFEW